MSRAFRFSAIAPGALLLALLGAAPAPVPVPDDLDREERLEVGQAAFRDNCLMCHAPEMTTRGSP